MRADHKHSSRSAAADGQGVAAFVQHGGRAIANDDKRINRCRGGKADVAWVGERDVGGGRSPGQGRGITGIGRQRRAVAAVGGEVGAIDQGPGQDAVVKSRRRREQHLIGRAAEVGADKVDGAPSLTRKAGEG